eukprot:TRINITY_DN5765_c0_g1_i3.p1 TRINITY_DN5765_c0_g1~~TRINITY_DN5765_c0_g1_i3.p1  ORF type:complete len:457 (+),score=102.61 TRINITY_DN5765_c0_g1_i3:81-1451(+)
MIRRPPRSTLSSSSAASDVYKRQVQLTIEDLESQHDPVADLEEEIQMIKGMEDRMQQVLDDQSAQPDGCVQFNPAADLERAREFFTCGMRFKGTIAIPGWNPDMDPTDTEPEERREYTLEVVMIREQHGQQVIYARHAAYGDEQSCTLELGAPTAPGSGVSVSYYDCETQCDGTLDLSNGNITGTVRQLVHGDAGFYHPADKVTHTFELAPSIAPSVAHRYGALGLAHMQRARLVAAWVNTCGEIPAAAVLEQASGFADGVAEVLSRVPWRETFTHCSSSAEDLCAKLRDQAKVLQELHLERQQTRQAELASVIEVLPRLLAHTMADAAINELQSVFRCWASFSLLGGQGPEHREGVNYGLLTMCKSHERLERAYSLLHKAIESADRRVARDTLKSWCQDGDGQTDCAICMITLELEDQALKLPCGHIFHEECCTCLLYTSPSPRDRTRSRMPSSA